MTKNFKLQGPRTKQMENSKRQMLHTVIAVLSTLCALCGEINAAETIDLDVSTPAIAKLKAAVAQRAEMVAKHKDFGHMGEGKDGLLKIRSLEGVKLAEKKGIEDLVEAENTDRRALYREILNAHKLGDSEAGKVMETAAARRRKESAPGHWVERPSDGKWELARDAKE